MAIEKSRQKLLNKAIDSFERKKDRSKSTTTLKHLNDKLQSEKTHLKSYIDRRTRAFARGEKNHFWFRWWDNSIEYHQENIIKLETQIKDLENK